MVDSVKGKHKVYADVLIDDDPKVLDITCFSSFVPIRICIAHPWNEEYRKRQGEKLIIVDNIVSATKLIQEEIVPAVNEWTTSWC